MRRITLLTLVLATLALLAVGGVGTAFAGNDLRSEASGPLLNGVVYQESIGTENDVDWYLFYSGTTTEVDIALQSLGPDSCFGQVMQLTDADGKFLAGYGYSINRNETQHIRYTVGVGTFYLAVSPYNVAPCIGSSAIYRFWVNASSTLLSAPPYIPPPPSPVATPTTDRSAIRAAKECEHARQRVSGLLRKLRQASGINYRNAIRRDIRRARAEVGRRC